MKFILQLCKAKMKACESRRDLKENFINCRSATKKIKQTNKKMQSIIQTLIQEIKKKKTLSKLDDKIVETKLNTLLNQNPKTKKLISSEENYEKIKKSKLVKEIIKQTRNDFNIIYGQFQSKEPKHTNKLLEQLKKELNSTNLTEQNILELHNNLLKTHLSTKERIKDQEKIIKEIIVELNKNKTRETDSLNILDLACGFNPFSIPFWLNITKIKKISYTCSDFTKQDQEIIENYFKILSNKYNELKGESIQLDISKPDSENHKIFSKKYDFALIWKTLDLIDHKQAENFINKIDSDLIIISFSTVTVKNRRMNVKKRSWLHKLLRRLNLKYEIKEYSNELFYFIEKK
ncbi:hypothetical protein HN814_04360 [Candidatus Woesearchaeota archaeon]|nr:hypothetical protein [Candidatus Woesearchaeota archaeon]